MKYILSVFAHAIFIVFLVVVATYVVISLVQIIGWWSLVLACAGIFGLAAWGVIKHGNYDISLKNIMNLKKK